VIRAIAIPQIATPYYWAIMYELSFSQRRLLRLVESVGFGKIIDLRIQAGQPVLDPPPRIQRELKFGVIPTKCRSSADTGPAVRSEHTELLELIRTIGSGRISVIEIRHSLPFRATLIDNDAAGGKNL